MIEAVFFDYDGVLTTDRTGTLTTCRYLSSATGVPFDPLMNALKRHNEALTTGRITYAAIWPQLCAEVCYDIPLDMLHAAFASTPANAEMFELARRLKPACHVGIISDNKADRMAFLRAHQRLDSLFDPIVVSAELGSTKEDTAIFERALAVASTRPRATVFIDNNRKNLESAARLGINVVYFDDATNDVRTLAEQLARDYRLPVLSAV